MPTTYKEDEVFDWAPVGSEGMPTTYKEDKVFDWAPFGPEGRVHKVASPYGRGPSLPCVEFIEKI